MWKITTRGFTLQQVLIMVAMNAAAARQAKDNTSKRSGTAPRAKIY